MARINRGNLIKYQRVSTLGADGGAWIKAGGKRISGITYVMDEFHLKKYLIKMTNHLMDSADDARKLLCEMVKDGSKEDFLSVVDMLEYHASSDKEMKRIQEGTDYILDNWSAAKTRLRYRRIPHLKVKSHRFRVENGKKKRLPLKRTRKHLSKRHYLQTITLKRQYITTIMLKSLKMALPRNILQSLSLVRRSLSQSTEPAISLMLTWMNSIFQRSFPWNLKMAKSANLSIRLHLRAE